MKKNLSGIVFVIAVLTVVISISIFIVLFSRRESDLTIDHETTRDTETQASTRTMNVMTFNIKGCRFTDEAFYTAMWNRIVDELITKVDANGRRYIYVSLAGFEEVDDFCGVRNEDALNGVTQNPTEDYYFIRSLERYFVKDRDFFVYQRKIKSEQGGDFNSFSQMMFSVYPMELLSPETNWPLSAKITIPDTSRPLYFHVMHPRGNSASCSSNTAYLDRAETISQGSTNIIYAGDFNARYYSGACNSPRVNENYTFSVPIDPQNPEARLDIIDYVMAHKQSDWVVESAIMDRTWDVKKDGIERYWSDHNPVIATLKYTGSAPVTTETPITPTAQTTITPTSATATATPTTNPGTSITPQPTSTVTSIPPTATVVPTATLTSSPTPSNSPSPTATATPTSTPTPTATPTSTPTPTATPTFTPIPTATLTPTPTIQPVPSAPSDLTINDTPPGFSPLTILMISLGLLFTGLLL
ncbi:hypothetical protein IPM65_06895 [Candidatus Roizmanbacteria bacterium]|nr:MAG: hypothetical protein IPM65_06895 [Candidatus Roizmanbacteria bacterium]